MCVCVRFWGERRQNSGKNNLQSPQRRPPASEVIWARSGSRGLNSKQHFTVHCCSCCLRNDPVRRFTSTLGVVCLLLWNLLHVFIPCSWTISFSVLEMWLPLFFVMLVSFSLIYILQTSTHTVFVADVILDKTVCCYEKRPNRRRASHRYASHNPGHEST